MNRPATLTDDFLRSLVARVPSTAGGTHKLTEVYSGEVLVELPQSTPTDIEAAYDAAREAQREWSQRPVADRLKVFAAGPHAAHRPCPDHGRPDPGRVREEPADGDRGDL